MASRPLRPFALPESSPRCIDLTGLPPTPSAVAAYRRDEAPSAWERLSDGLLASPRFGERFACHWLDLVHFGETHAFVKAKPRPNAWPYRDYVIVAFNASRIFQLSVAGGHSQQG